MPCGDLSGVLLQGALQPHRGSHGPARGILVGDRCPEQDHHAVAGETRDVALVMVDRFGHAGQAFAHDRIHAFFTQLFGQRGGPHGVGKQHRHAPALTFRRTPAPHLLR